MASYSKPQKKSTAKKPVNAAKKTSDKKKLDAPIDKTPVLSVGMDVMVTDADVSNIGTVTMVHEGNRVDVVVKGPSGNSALGHVSYMNDTESQPYWEFIN